MNNKLAISLVCFAVLFSSLLRAQAPAPARTVVRPGHVLDVRSGKLLDNQAIVIEGDKIVSVSAASSAPAGATVIDLPNATVLPGLIDAHTHLTMNPKFG